MEQFAFIPASAASGSWPRTPPPPRLVSPWPRSLKNSVAAAALGPSRVARCSVSEKRKKPVCQNPNFVSKPQNFNIIIPIISCFRCKS